MQTDTYMYTPVRILKRPQEKKKKKNYEEHPPPDMGQQIAQQRVKEEERTESYLDIDGNINCPQKPVV